MTFEEAAAVLGLALPCARKDARKAYLGLIKVHKPERDPEGFRRVREAWERLEHAGDPIGAPRPSPAAANEGPVWPVPELSDPLEAFRERMDASDEAPETLIAIAREAVAAHPDLPDAYYLLYDQLVYAEEEEEAAALLRAGHERGFLGFFDNLVAWHPSQLTELEFLELADAKGISDSAPALALEMARRGLYSAALEMALRALSHDPAGQRLWRLPLYRLYFTLVGAGQLEGAAQLWAALDEEARTRGRRSARLSLAGVPVDGLARQVDDVAAQLPSDMRSAMMDALLADFSQASLAQVQQVAQGLVVSVEWVRELLERRAPILHDLYGDFLQIIPDPAQSTASSTQGANAFLGLLFFLFIIVMLGNCSRLVSHKSEHLDVLSRVGGPRDEVPADAGALLYEPVEEGGSPGALMSTESHVPAP